MKRKYPLFILVFISSLVYPENNPVTDEKSNTNDVELNEIVVQASRTSTKQKEMPASVSIISASSLELNEMNTLNNSTAFIPNFYMPDYGTKLTSPVYIRGIGSRINAPSVGMYVDNIPYFEKASFDFDFFDVQKIEVLRGPQGTLFGRNSMGGLINISTWSPADYQGTHLRASVANYGQYKLNAGHYNKISEQLAFSVALNYLHQDGFYLNTTLDEKVDKLDAYGVRLKGQYQIDDRWSLELVSNTDISNQGGYPYALYNRNTQTMGEVNYNQRSGYDRMLMSNALKLGYAAPEWELSNTLSYQLLDDEQQIDQDFGPDSLHFAGQLQFQHNLANETIIRSNTNNRYKWLFGMFAFNQQAENTVDVNSYKTKTDTGLVHYTYQKQYGPVSSGVAVFHQSSYNIIPQLTLTAGIRLDYEQSSIQYKYNGIMGETVQTPVDTVYPALRDMVVLPKLAIAYAPGDKINVYASYSTGYKPGGFNSTFEKPEHLMFKKEISHNYEAGVKVNLFQYFYADFALFYTDLKNQQIYRTAPSGRGSYLDNSGLSRNKGVEFTLHNQSFHGFEGMVAYGYTHAKILKYELSNAVNYNDKFTPYVPGHTLALQATQTLTFKYIKWMDKLRFNVLYSRTGSLYWNLSNTLKEADYGLLNGKISLISGKYQFDVWGKNLTNTRYHAFLFESLPNVYAQSGKPLQVGVNFSVKW